MVRSLVGTLLEVGAGLRPPEDVARALEARDRAQAAPVAPAKGLTLMEVRYRRNPFARAK
jgi:tRNA pseudouridine38-40 synthase